LISDESLRTAICRTQNREGFGGRFYKMKVGVSRKPGSV